MKFIPRFDVRLVRDGRVATLEPTVIRHPSDTLPILEAELSELAYERFVALALNTKNHLTAVLPVSSGSLNASIVHPRELFQRAILANCAALIYDQLPDLNWAGFYFVEPGSGDLVVGPFQGKPACARIAPGHSAQYHRGPHGGAGPAGLASVGR